MTQLNKRITCADGFSMSVQANASAYCEPRVDNAKAYVSVEVGFPSHYEALLVPYAEDMEDYTGTVYGWVPSAIVTAICVKHGGVIDGDLPIGMPILAPAK